MELIPHDELKTSHGINFAPMIDFLFLMLALFASLAMSRSALYDSAIDLIQIKPNPSHSSLKPEPRQIHLSIDSNGLYKWITEFSEYPMPSLGEIQQELMRQYQIGALPQDKSQTEILLHIDEKAPWDPIAQAIFAIREVGFQAHPVYTVDQTGKKGN